MLFFAPRSASDVQFLTADFSLCFIYGDRYKVDPSQSAQPANAGDTHHCFNL